MHRFVIAVVSVSFLAVCATTTSSSGGQGGQPGPTQESQQIKNIAHFDVGTCFAAAPEVSAPVVKESVLAVQVSARPLVLECLVNPASRAGAPVTKVTVESTFAAGAFSHKATGENLTADGEKCIVDALTRYTQAKVAGTENAAPVSNSFDYQHDVNQDPSVVMGINEISDLVGAIRVATPTWCDCFEPVKETVPSPIPVKVDVKKAAGAADAGSTITVAASVDQALADGGAGVDETLSQCLIGKIQALPFSTMKSQQDIFPYFFIFTNFEARGDQQVADLNVRFTQLDLQRGQRTADRLLSFAKLNGAAASYTELVNKYKAKPASVTRTQLVTRCNAMVKADEEYVAVLRDLKAVADLQLTTVQELRKADPMYPAEVEEHTVKEVATTTSDLTASEQTLTNDKAICTRLAK